MDHQRRNTEDRPKVVGPMPVVPVGHDPAPAAGTRLRPAGITRATKSGHACSAGLPALCCPSPLGACPAAAAALAPTTTACPAAGGQPEPQPPAPTHRRRPDALAIAFSESVSQPLAEPESVTQSVTQSITEPESFATRAHHRAHRRAVPSPAPGPAPAPSPTPTRPAAAATSSAPATTTAPIQGIVAPAAMSNGTVRVLDSTGKAIATGKRSRPSPAPMGPSRSPGTGPTALRPAAKLRRAAALRVVDHQCGRHLAHHAADQRAHHCWPVARPRRDDRHRPGLGDPALTTAQTQLRAALAPLLTEAGLASDRLHDRQPHAGQPRRL